MELTALGIVVWELCIGLNAWLLTSLQNRSKYRAFPYLSAYLLYRFVRTLVIFPLFYVGNMNLYSRLYWVTDPVLLFLGIAAMADLFKGKRNYFLILGAVVCAVQAYLVVHKSNPAIEVEGLTWIFTVCCALLVLLRNRNLLALGWFVLAFFPAISGRLHILEHGRWLRMVPVFSLGAAYSLWIVWVRRLEPLPSEG